MADIQGKAKEQLILATIDILINKGLPAVTKLTADLSKKDVVTIEDIEAVKGELDSASYFE